MARTANFPMTSDDNHLLEIADFEQMDSRLPLYVRLTEAIRGQIASGRWSCDRPLPGESTLAGIYSVSIGTVRQAIQKLVEQGLLERRHGSGTYVRRCTFDGSLVRCFGAPEGHDGVSEPQIVSRAVSLATGRAAERLALTSADHMIVLNAIRYRSDEPALVETIVLPRDPFLPLLDGDVSTLSKSLHVAYETLCGKIIAQAEEVMTIERADARAAKTLRLEPGRALVAIERVSYGHGGNPLEWRLYKGAADTFVFETSIR